MHESLLEALLKHGLLGLISRVPDPVVLGWDLRIRVSNKFPGDAVAAVPGTVLYHLLFSVYFDAQIFPSLASGKLASVATDRFSLFESSLTSLLQRVF